MALRRVLAAGFKHHGKPALTETELVAALALERGWFAPDEARQLISYAIDSGDLDESDGSLSATFDVGEVTIPSGYEPPDDLIEPPTPFERIVEQLEAAGFDKREAVADINRLQTDAGVTGDAAAILFAHQNGIDVTGDALRHRRELEADAS